MSPRVVQARTDRPAAPATTGALSDSRSTVPLMFLSRAALYAITFRKAAEGGMVQRVSTVAFEGIDARAVDVQVQVAPGLQAFAIVRTIKPAARK
jgi:hypothetical protein